jgi:hypothetical protein
MEMTGDRWRSRMHPEDAEMYWFSVKRRVMEKANALLPVVFGSVFSGNDSGTLSPNPWDFSLCCRSRRRPAWATEAAQACGIRAHRGARVASQQSPILRVDSSECITLRGAAKPGALTE